MVKPVFSSTTGSVDHYDIRLPGDPDKKTYQVSQQELMDNSDQFSSGDLNSKAIELAMNKWQKDHTGGKYDIHAGGANALSENAGQVKSDLQTEPAAGQPVLATVGAYKGNKLIGTHALNINSYDSKTNTVDYSNPWDPSKHYQQNFDDFHKGANEDISMPDAPNRHFGALQSLNYLQPGTTGTVSDWDNEHFKR